MSQKLDTAIKIAEKFKSVTDHMLTIPELEEKYVTSVTNGITQEEAAKRRFLFGKNIPTYFPNTGLLFFIRLLRTSFSELLLVITAIFTIWCCIWADISYLKHIFTGVTAIILIANLIQTIRARRHQEKQKAILSLKEITVIRKGQEIKTTVSQLVSGDLVKINIGDIIPADLRIVESDQLAINNSLITGETQPTPRSVKNTSEDFLQSENIAFATTTCSKGSGKGVVIATGEMTFLSVVGSVTSPYQHEQYKYDLLRVRRTTRILLKIMTSLLGIIAIICFALRHHFGQQLINLISTQGEGSGNTGINQEI